MSENEAEKRAVLSYLDLQYAIERRLGLSVEDAKKKVMDEFKKKVGVLRK